MVSIAVDGDLKAGVRKQRDGVPGLQILLASAGSVGESPRWHNVSAKRIVHPLGYLVAKWGHISECSAKDSFIHPTRPQKNLHGNCIAARTDIKCGMKAEHAAVL